MDSTVVSFATFLFSHIHMLYTFLHHIDTFVRTTLYAKCVYGMVRCVSVRPSHIKYESRIIKPILQETYMDQESKSIDQCRIYQSCLRLS